MQGIGLLKRLLRISQCGMSFWLHQKHLNICFFSASFVVLDYRGLASSPKEFLGFPELARDFQESRKLFENVDEAVRLYEFARYKPGVSDTI